MERLRRGKRWSLFSEMVKSAKAKVSWWFRGIGLGSFWESSSTEADVVSMDRAR